MGTTAINTANATVDTVGSTVGTAMHEVNDSFRGHPNQPEPVLSELLHPKEEQGEDLLVLLIIRGKVRQRNIASVSSI